ncbi:MAG: cysteine--tRNA ligase [Alphaproteobacteria bacterium]|nr:cysteine--tRNA ligase [Alphaproteobacteria bacterium]
MQLYNTMTRKTEELQPMDGKTVKMYCCGPTVYSDAHIGNLRSYIFEDILHKTIELAGFDLKHVMNITDVGHLTNDELDTGEDKMVKAAKAAKTTVLDIAKMYEEKFFNDCKKLRIERPFKTPRATEYVGKMIAFAKALEEKGYAYLSGGNLYFDTSKFKRYGLLSGQKIEDRNHGERVEVDENKKNQSDFVLWFTQSKFEDHALKWNSPWGEGYPGWHLECSVMSMDTLGEEIDIHCGGVDNLFPHHENEIAQSEAYTGKKWVNFWLHGEHLNLKEGKMSKSKGHKFTVSSLEEKGYLPEHYRYLCLTAHYRTQLIFSYENLDSAKNTYNNLVKKIKELKKEASKDSNSELLDIYILKFNNYLFDDLNSPRALATMWEALKDAELSAKDKLSVISNAEKVFSLGLTEIEVDEALEIPEDVQVMLDQRQEARANKDWVKSDEIRDHIASMGFAVKDTKDGQELSKI